MLKQTRVKKTVFEEFPIIIENDDHFVIKKGVSITNFVKLLSYDSELDKVSDTPYCNVVELYSKGYLQKSNNSDEFKEKINSQNVITGCPLDIVTQSYIVLRKETDSKITPLKAFFYKIVVEEQFRIVDDQWEKLNSKYKVFAVVDEYTVDNTNNILKMSCPISIPMEEYKQIGTGFGSMKNIGLMATHDYIKRYRQTCEFIIPNLVSEDIIGYYYHNIFYNVNWFDEKSSTIFGKLIPNNGLLINDSNEGMHKICITSDYISFCHKNTLYVGQNKAYLNGEIVCDGLIQTVESKKIWNIINDDYSSDYVAKVLEIFPTIKGIETINSTFTI